MNPHILAKLIVDNVLLLVNDNVSYKEYVIVVENLLNKYAISQPCEEDGCREPALMCFCEKHAP